MDKKTGKPGTFSPDDFNTLKTLAETHGAETLAKKVAKACNNKANALSHEYSNSAVAKAYAATAKKVMDALPGASSSIPGAAFVSVGQLVGKYGPELVVLKLAKIAKKSNATSATKLSSIFPSI